MSEFYNDIATQDITYILENPWQLTESEWRLQDPHLRASTFSDIIRRLKLCLETGYTKLWKTPNEEPIAILGGYKIADTTYETFFIASSHMEDYALKLSFDMRNLLAEKATIHKGGTCRLYSTSDHPSQMTWFRFLGFKHVPEKDVENTRYFEYKAPRA